LTTGGNYGERKNNCLVVVAFCGSVGFAVFRAKDNRTAVRHNIGTGLNDCRSSAYYDDSWRANRHSVGYPWFFADDTKYFLSSFVANKAGEDSISWSKRWALEKQSLSCKNRGAERISNKEFRMMKERKANPARENPQ